MDANRDAAIECRFTLRLGTRAIDASARVPARPVTPDDLLPLLQSLTDAIIETAIDEVESRGAKASCRRGCVACCYQPVPVSPAEARTIHRLVEGFEPLLRAQIELRFASALATLEAHGLVGPARNLRLVARDGQSEEFALRCFALGLACPFLEDGACLIYARRPLTCRQYVVTSPPGECLHPNPERVHTVPLPGEPSHLLCCFEDGKGDAPPQIMTLATALEWAAAHPDPPSPQVPGPQWLENFVRRLAGSPPDENAGSAPG